ncbi:MAG: hypothetical protein ACRC33_03325 [Gemmataceae bacterium]
MADTHVRDGTWTVDLIWKYLHEVSKPGRRAGSWFDKMDPGGVLNDRHRVYEMLVDEPHHTNPQPDEVARSMIPWNQNNKELFEAFGKKWACGSVVKLSFLKYMNGGAGDQPAKGVDSKGFDAAAWVTQSLDKGRPVRAHLGEKHHYVGIVGYRAAAVATPTSRFEYLVMEPWAGGAATGGATIKYAGASTKFLGVMKEQAGRLEYDGYKVTSVSGPHPF